MIMECVSDRATLLAKARFLCATAASCVTREGNKSHCDDWVVPHPTWATQGAGTRSRLLVLLSSRNVPVTADPWPPSGYGSADKAWMSQPGRYWNNMDVASTLYDLGRAVPK